MCREKPLSDYKRFGECYSIIEQRVLREGYTNQIQSLLSTDLSERGARICSLYGLHDKCSSSPDELHKYVSMLVEIIQDPSSITAESVTGKLVDFLKNHQ